jgi:hypothetical protein
MQVKAYSLKPGDKFKLFEHDNVFTCVSNENEDVRATKENGVSYIFKGWYIVDLLEPEKMRFTNIVFDDIPVNRSFDYNGINFIKRNIYFDEDNAMVSHTGSRVTIRKGTVVQIRDEPYPIHFGHFGCDPDSISGSKELDREILLNSIEEIITRELKFLRQERDLGQGDTVFIRGEIIGISHIALELANKLKEQDNNFDRQAWRSKLGL